ncbi:hypothetical protein Zmor_001837 [Zophobas morio]|uniref:Uncharacterized protein n=1 Tax=Zophobas morio TaxID=2755281 RepID=A0AA38J4W8_9CUCU|nr:hypothetical protein Zmor_001837 [Zophobas morio]
MKINACVVRSSKLASSCKNFKIKILFLHVSRVLEKLYYYGASQLVNLETCSLPTTALLKNSNFSENVSTAKLAVLPKDRGSPPPHFQRKASINQQVRLIKPNPSALVHLSPSSSFASFYNRQEF